jgi:small subunit ribosomal protein S16
MLVIRMRRAGSKKRPFFRIVVTEHSSKRDGRFVEVIGHYNARTTPETLVLDGERLNHWVKNGAQPSDTVRTLVDRNPAALAAKAADVAAAEQAAS